MALLDFSMFLGTMLIESAPGILLTLTADTGVRSAVWPFVVMKKPRKECRVVDGVGTVVKFVRPAEVVPIAGSITAVGWLCGNES